MKPALVLLALCLSACGGPSSTAAGDESALTAGPTAFALQFAGTYLGPAGARLELRPHGSYLFALGGSVEQGRYAAAPVKALPLMLHLMTRTLREATITAYDGHLSMNGQVFTLERPALSDEELCDGSGGFWTDDDADPRTGLYCVCPAAEVFIPAAGGCTTNDGFF